MDIMFKMYHEQTIAITKLDKVRGLYFKPISLKEFLSNRILSYGFTNIFWDLQSYSKNRTLIDNLRYKKARSKWNAFSKNNIKFSDGFMKIGDTIEATSSLGTIYRGTVIEFPKEFSGAFRIRKDNGDESTVSILGCPTIKINGVEKKPEFYIKLRRKIYGINKR